nr:MAG TPA: hypothetical protein [Caudoviricetes sp.]
MEVLRLFFINAVYLHASLSFTGFLIILTSFWISK